MKLAYTISGETYHRQKERFKLKMREYGLKWVGTFDNPEWASDKDSLTAIFIRNEENTFTVEAQLMWEGNGKTEFYQFFKEFCEHFKGVLMEGETNMKKVTDTDILLFDKVFKPNVEQMKREGCPQKFIDMAMNDYNEKKKDMMGGNG